ncbi:ABC transporter ATP-binding protein/permease [Mycobacterium sp. AZCC_0083]|uniref:ABC transporter ATP-binding protein/permease n=1 Tax=Mycobacterium sp. AZCC_0083 TaxID=2735882 RepID=UPI00161E83A3|nr:ABC transporter ATP-binding protein/permease [Mycobacterium sp. AZCC_0083]MBB5160885.1 putative ATP-binding cassette transporter [Mycobacterium sp. AZCC_0083]
MEMFTPSLDWGAEIVDSLVWIAKAWVISALCTLVVLTLIARFTTWGRQFWRITGDYFKGRQSVSAWAFVAVLLLSVMIDVRLSVLFSYQSNDQFSAMQAAVSDEGVAKDSAIDGFWVAMLIYLALAVSDIVRTLLDLYLMQRFIIRWRVWLTHRVTGDWLDGDAYYRGRFLAGFGDEPIDNPDQRIQQDIDIFTTGTGPETNTPTVGTSQTLVFGAITSILSVVSFTPILWSLAGPLTVFGVTVPKALFWLALVYVFFTTVIAFWIGRPLIRLSFRNELTNAAFRYALVRLRDAGEAVGFYRGERAEGGRLMTRFAAIITNYRAFVRRGVLFQGWNRSVHQIVSPLPTVVQIPRVFAGEIQLGDMTQSSSAFLSVHDSLSFFRAVYDSFAGYRAAIIRLDGLLTANERARALPSLTALPSTDGSVELDDVEVRTPEGVQLVDPLDVRLDPGDSLVITGESGTGKTTLLRSLAQLWPFTSGTLRSPEGATMFLSQMPYAPLGDLRSVVSYPGEGGDFGDAAVHAALDTVALGHLGSRLDEVADWAKVLSPGEQQRIAFARVLLVKPSGVFLDESTSALDEGQEFALYRSLRTQLPDCIVVSVSHRGTVEQHHRRRLELLGGGGWRLGPVAEAPLPV